ncbi:hypothetical protein ACP4OV_019997 [Aristida adscensionis]
MAAALGDGGEVAAAIPLYVCEADADVGRVVPLSVSKVKAAAALKLKMRVDGDKEVFQQWEHSEEAEDPEWEAAQSTRAGRRGRGGRASPSSSPCGRHCTTGHIRGYNPERARPVVYHIFQHDPSFHLHEESTIQPARHTAALATNLPWSANILSIRVLNSTVCYPVNLYGSVYVRDDLERRRVYLFRRDRGNAQLVKSPEEALVLTGPSRGLFVCDNLFFEIDLKMRCDREVDDMNFSQGTIHYNHVVNASWLVTQRSSLLTDELATKVSTMELKYAPVRRAVEATIQIKAREASHKTFGKISVFITDISEEIVLFDSGPSGAVINIGDDGLFELWRSVISVPIYGSLLLRVDTWEGDCKANFSRCSTIFTPQICGEDVAPCTSHKIRVKVTWSPLYVAKYDLK